MKTRLAIIAVLAATAGVSTGASADGILDPAAQGVSDLNAVAPVLYPSEQGAFKGLEVATPLVEASILQKGCEAAEYALNVATNGSGYGSVTLDGVKFNVAGSPANPNGRLYTVTGPVAPYDDLGDLTVSGLSAYGSYNIGSGIQELTTDFDLTSSVTAESDHFRGTIIKDYVRLSGFLPVPVDFYSVGRKVSTVVDYGYQQIQKNKYVAAKYWQQSQTWRQNGVKAGTWWVKTRVAPEGDCTIVVHLEGTNGKANQHNLQGFNETGTITVNVANSQGVPGIDFKN
jgi:hypothetical protein